MRVKNNKGSGEIKFKKRGRKSRVTHCGVLAALSVGVWPVIDGRKITPERFVSDLLATNAMRKLAEMIIYSRFNVKTKKANPTV